MNLPENPPSVGLSALTFGNTVTSATTLWNWLALVIAALGFWRILAFAAYINCDKPPTPPPPAPVRRDQLPEPKTGSLPPDPTIDSQPEISHPRNADGESDCHVAVCHKSAVFEAFDCSWWCLRGEEEHGEDEEGGEGEVVDADGVFQEEEEEEETTTMAATRMFTTRMFTRGDLGWYRYQDPTAINGNVIQLWEDHHHRRTSPSGRLLRRYWSM